MLPETRFRKWFDNLDKNILIAFVSTIIIGLICHIYMMTNKWVNLDDIVQLIDKMDRTTSGRWFLRFPSAISSDFSLPWLNGFLTIIYTAVISVFIVKMFNIKSRINTILISGILITFPTIGALMPFMNTQDSYQFGAMMAGIAAYLLVSKKRGYIYSTILLTLSLAIYQTYLGYAAGLILIYIILNLFKNEDNFDEMLKLFFKTALSFIVAIGIYLFVSRVIFGHLLVDYKGLDSMGSIPLNELPKAVLNTYIEMFKFLFGLEFNYHFPFMKYLFSIGFVSFIFLFMFILRRSNIESKKEIFALLILVIFPIAMNVIYIMSWQAGVMLRMAYGYTLLFIAPLLLIDHILKNKRLLLNKDTSKETEYNTKIAIIATWFLTLTISLSVYNNIYVTNKAYFKVGITNQSSHAYGNRIVQRLEMFPGYTEDTKIVFLGRPDSRTRFTKEYDTEDIEPFIIANHLTRLYSFKYYPVRFLGFPNTISDYTEITSEIEHLRDTINSMPVYPAADSIKMIDDIIYIKFKDIK